jgi:hypothetical protein
LVYQILLQWTADSNADSLVDSFSEMNDGRSAFELLRINYEGTDYRQTAITARQKIEKAFYLKDGPNFNFDTYCKRHSKPNQVLKYYKVLLDVASQVTSFLNGIKTPEFQIVKPSIINDPICSTDLMKAIAKFKTQIITICRDDRNRALEKKPVYSIGSTESGHDQGQKFSNYNQQGQGGQGGYCGAGRRHGNGRRGYNSGQGYNGGRGNDIIITIQIIRGAVEVVALQQIGIHIHLMMAFTYLEIH